MDRLLRESLAAPIPTLPTDFDQKVLRKLGRRPQPLDRYRRILLTVYGLVSVLTSAVVMRSQGLDWGPIALMTLVAAAVLPAAGAASSIRARRTNALPLTRP